MRSFHKGGRKNAYISFGCGYHPNALLAFTAVRAVRNASPSASYILSSAQLESEHSSVNLTEDEEELVEI